LTATAVLKLHSLLPDGREDTLELSDTALTVYPGSPEQLPEELRGELALESVELRIEQQKEEPEAVEEPRRRRKKPEPPQAWLRVRVTPAAGEDRPRPLALAWSSTHFDIPAAEAFADRFAAITGKEVRPAPAPEPAPEEAGEAPAEAAPDAGPASETAPAEESAP